MWKFVRRTTREADVSPTSFADRGKRERERREGGEGDSLLSLLRMNSCYSEPASKFKTCSCFQEHSDEWIRSRKMDEDPSSAPNQRYETRSSDRQGTPALRSCCVQH